MKLSISSSACSAAFERGDLTQLEFIDAAARELHADGIVLNVRHFPRTDADYLAQIKKMSVDLGLCVAALASDDFFTADESGMREQIAWALGAGAPILSARLAAETSLPWSDQLARISVATGLAKAANVTLAVRNAPSTFAATAHDCKRVSKEADSAWLRFALDPAAFDAASDWTALLERAVLAVESAGAPPSAARWTAFNGFVVLTGAGAMTLPEMNEAMRQWRTARANLELNRI